MIRFPSESLLSKSTLFGCDSSMNSVGGAMLTASLRNDLILLPSLRRASSAASSAFSMSLSLFAASDRKRETMDWASLTMSAGRESGLSGWDCTVCFSSGVDEAPASAADCSDGSASTGFVRESPLVLLTMSAHPLEACVVAAVLIFWASS